MTKTRSPYAATIGDVLRLIRVVHAHANDLDMSADILTIQREPMAVLAYPKTGSNYESLPDEDADAWASFQQVTRHIEGNKRLEDWRARGLPKGFKPATHWTRNRLQWYSNGDTLQQFSAKVEQVKLVLGPPDECTSSSTWSEDSIDELCATWEVVDPIDGARVEFSIRSCAPTGCKIDPRVQPQERREVQIHPECRSVLEGLTE